MEKNWNIMRKLMFLGDLLGSRIYLEGRGNSVSSSAIARTGLLYDL